MISRIDLASTDLLPNNPFRPLDWRWRRSVQLLETKARRLRRDDGWVARCRAYLTVLTRVSGNPIHPRLARDHADILGAHQIHLGDSRRRWELEARLLAGQNDDEIGGRVGLTPGVVEAYEALYFVVRARLSASDWVAARVIGPRMYEGFTADDIDIVWKVLAYNHGPMVLDALIDADRGQRRPDLAGPIDLLVKVMTATVTPNNALGFLRLDVLSRENVHADAALCVATVTQPLVIPPIDVHLGPETLPIVRAGCVQEDSGNKVPTVLGGQVGLSDAG